MILSYALLVFLTLLFFILTFRKSDLQKNLPPGPRKLPFIGNLHQIGELPYLSLQELSSHHGPLMFLKLGSVPTLVVSSAEIAKEIFKNHDLAFSGRPKLYAGNRLGYNGSAMTFTPYGNYWKEIRKIVMLELLSAKRVQSFQAVRFEEVQVLLHSIALSCGSPVNLSHLTLSLTNNIVCRIAFGTRFGDASSKFYEMLRETQELLGGFCLADFFPWLGWLNKFNGYESRLEKNFKELDNFYDKVIKEHAVNNDASERLGVMEQHHDEDLVHVLLRLQKDSNQEIALSDDQIKGVLTDIFIAGTDTAAATMIWTMSELIRNPEKMERAQQEVREVVLSKKKVMVEESDLPMLPYLKSVVKEALRIHPPAPLLVPRETIQPCTIKGYEIPAGTRVFINAKTIAMDPTCWENPTEFSPERFLHSPIDFGGHHVEMLPFGAGRRGCPGVNFAMPLVELSLANLLFRFDWKLPDGVGREELDMQEAIGITMHKKSPLCLIPSPSFA
ncbi:cytochrome P450 71A9 [Arachis hypogaea]|uniref:Cytochrome P450 n=1 Tax=Arachis hypogaea TaxID=3818 RepID=A0A445CT83_ARAHY|nr:cytochrome P450 71A9 [Arachis hypogaea]QHO47099.1 Cytochrome P450 [Arachis hypogaea]RYR54122.1 hypothetical protein Ahy_A06g029380 [Arachis hypogaea]